MKLFILPAFFLVLSFNANSQTSIDSAKVKFDAQTVFSVVEVSAEFPGGPDAFGAFLKSNLKYPKEARKAKIEGKTYVEFVVERDGNILPENVRVVRGVHESLDQEAVRVIRLSPPWTPGYQRGRTVRVRIVIPINFGL